MEDLNLHFTGDFHAITSANNLLAALLDNHIQQGNELGIDTRQVVWKRCEDMNDRVLRNIVVGLGSKADGTVREDHFVITVASEIMAILCLATDMADLKERLSRIVVAYNFAGQPVTAGDLKAVGAMAALLKDAIKPNLIQTLEHTPAIVHGGPFANIAHGCNSVRATKTALKTADYVITEAGFGADLGAEKFFDIKCRMAGLRPDAVVLVATVRALKYNGGVPKAQLSEGNLDALKKGIVNLEKHIENIQKFGVPVVVTLNSFVTDTQEETDYVRAFCEERGCEFALSEVWEKGGKGGIALAGKVLKTLKKRRATSTSYTISPSRSGKKSASWPGKSMGRTESSGVLRPRVRRRSWKSSGSAICRCAWPKPSIPSPTIRSFWAGRKASRSACAKSTCPQGPAL